MKARWWWLLGLVIPAGFAIGFAIPPPPLPKAVMEADRWALAQPPSAPDDATSIILASPWGNDAAGEGSSEWKLVGTVLPDHALVRVGDTDTRRIAVGQPFPDQSILLAVTRSRIVIERSACRLVYSVYNPEPVSTSGEGCPPPAEFPEASESQDPAQAPTRESRSR